MKQRRTRALLVASWTLGGCNVLVGLDDVNIVQDGSGGSTGSTGAGAPDESATTAGAGAPGSAAQGGDAGASAASSGGGGGGTSSSSSGGGGGASTASSGGGGSASTASSGGGASTASSGGGDTTQSTGGTGGGAPQSPCGNGVVADGEQCDDGNGSAGDGCSDTCKVEPFYQCTVSGPSVCSAQEVLCADGADGDGDGLIDLMDPDCILPAYAPSIACNNLRVYRSANVPLAVPDKGDGKAQSQIFVPDALFVVHTAVLVDIPHPHAVDLQATLIPPFGQPRLLTSDNGGGGADYTETLFDSSCLQSVTVGAAPFQGCYKPESFLPANGQQAKGVWTLEVEDHITGKTGTLTAWTLILCEP